MMLEILPGVFAVPVIIGVIELLKLMGFNKKHSPIAAIVLGQAFALTNQYFGATDIYVSVVTGLLLALCAVGLYSGVKNEIEEIKG